ncbi:MAG: hypothetical protein N3F63_01150 [Thermoplasmata archaeon]|nr:hypothetical protein [Thermoplasmata archaeon]
MNDNDFTISDLALIYEKEKKSKTLTKVRKDFYQQATQCIQKLRARYQKELATNPDSKMTEMARREFERARKDLENTVHMRTIKILRQSHDHYFNYDNEFLSALTDEEKRFLEGIMAVIAQFVANAWLWDKSLPPQPVQQPAAPKPVEKPEPEKAQMKPLPLPENLGETGEPPKKNLVIMFLTESSLALPEQNLYYRKGDIASLPEKIARVLVKEKKASLVYPM